MDEKELEEKRQAIMKKNGKYRVRWVHDGIVLTRMLIQKKIISIIIIIIIIIIYIIGCLTEDVYSEYFYCIQ